MDRIHDHLMHGINGDIWYFGIGQRPNHGTAALHQQRRLIYTETSRFAESFNSRTCRRVTSLLLHRTERVCMYILLPESQHKNRKRRSVF
jgi:hypothetical protein